MDRSEGALLIAEKAMAMARKARDGLKQLPTAPKGAVSFLVDGAGDLVVVYDDGTTAACGHVRGADGAPGVSIIEVGINEAGELVARLSDGRSVNAGMVRGRDGKDGAAGRDGIDGLGFDDLDIAHDGERSFTFRLARGEQVKEWTFVLPFVIDRGVFREGTRYLRGDAVTWAGSLWIAQADTEGKPETKDCKDWRLAVKRGRDGKDGATGDRGLPGPKGEPGRDGTRWQ